MGSEDTFVLVPLRNRNVSVTVLADENHRRVRTVKLHEQNLHPFSAASVGDFNRTRTNMLLELTSLCATQRQYREELDAMLGRVDFLEATRAACCAHQRFSESENFIRCRHIQRLRMCSCLCWNLLYIPMVSTSADDCAPKRLHHHPNIPWGARCEQPSMRP
jgi:hypothetical protein